MNIAESNRCFKSLWGLEFNSNCLREIRFPALSRKPCTSCLKTEIIVLTYPWTPVTFYIHLCLQALQGWIWPHTAAYFWGLHCNYHNGHLSPQIWGECGENPFHSHVFSIIFPPSYTHISFQFKNISFPCRQHSWMGTAHYFLRSFFSSKFPIFIWTLALCFLTPGKGLWAWSLLLDGSVLYSSYLPHVRYSHLWMNWKSPRGAFLKESPCQMPSRNLTP